MTPEEFAAALEALNALDSAVAEAAKEHEGEKKP